MKFPQEKEKSTHTTVNEKRKTEKSWTLFYNKLLYKAHLIIIYFFYLVRSFAMQFQLFDIRMTQKYQQGKLGATNSWEWLITIFVPKMISIV